MPSTPDFFVFFLVLVPNNFDFPFLLVTLSPWHLPHPPVHTYARGFGSFSVTTEKWQSHSQQTVNAFRPYWRSYYSNCRCSYRNSYRCGPTAVGVYRNSHRCSFRNSYPFGSTGVVTSAVDMPRNHDRYVGGGRRHASTRTALLTLFHALRLSTPF